MLRCNVCGGNVHVHGEIAGVLSTICDSCGANSMGMIQSSLAKKQSSETIEVVRRGNRSMARPSLSDSVPPCHGS